MKVQTSFNDGWRFSEILPDDPARQIDGEEVTLPHNAVELPFAYFDERVYQKPFTYQKTFATDPSWAGKEVGVRFEGAMANAKVFMNGAEICGHTDGYTPFYARLTEHLGEGENILTVVIDGSENPEIPPFGGTIDYLTYAGIYRDVWLEVRSPIYVDNVKVETPDALADRKSVVAKLALANPADAAISGTLSASLVAPDGKVVASVDQDVSALDPTVEINDLEGIELWDVKNPALYQLRVELKTPHGDDEAVTNFGFRTVSFTTEGFFLNGEHLKLRGLNRHQSFPYIGYALPKAAQERDAEIVRFELGCNVVRSSHYPPSPWFLDHCDRIGLLVLEEIPGWQHIGGELWKSRSVDNVRAMVERDWNHPSVIMWGVRINESLDDHDFYVKTNEVARSLDTTRPTGGIRCIENSELLEDIYTMNDFVMGHHEAGPNIERRALRPQQEVTGLDHNVPYLVTEFNGHMYPTKSYDQEQRQVEHALRHLEVMDAAYGDNSIAGCIGWCAFDYNTHFDFGSGDMICHHGVMDMFREPKFAAYSYLSQVDPSEKVVMEPVTFWTRGDRSRGGSLPLMVLTNCDEVEIYYGDVPPRRVKPDTENFPNLPHAPVIIRESDFEPDEISEWGSSWLDGKIVGFINGEAVAEVLMPARKTPTTLEVVADREVIAPKGDCVRVIARMLDQTGRKLPYFFEPATIDVSGAGELVGPSAVSTRGGSTGFWIKSNGKTGSITATVQIPAFGTQTIELRSEDI